MTGRTYKGLSIEELEKLTEEHGAKSVRLNPDGSVTVGGDGEEAGPLEALLTEIRDLLAAPIAPAVSRACGAMFDHAHCGEDYCACGCHRQEE